MSERPEVLRASPLQVGLVALHEIMGGEDGYTVATMVDVAGPLDSMRLQTACSTVLRRHPQICARFRRPAGDNPVLLVPSTPVLNWHCMGVDPSNLAEISSRCAKGDWNLRNGVTHRFDLLRVDDSTHRLILSFHHAVIDAWSLAVLVEEVLSIYADGTKDLTPPPALRSYAFWLGTRSMEREWAWWEHYLDGISGPTLVGLRAADREVIPRTTVQFLDAAEGEHLTATAASLGITSAALISVAWGLLLARMTGESDVIVGVSVSGRPAEVTDIDRMVGAFTTTVPLRIRLNPGESLAEACQRAHADLAEVAEHATLPLHHIEKTGGAGPLFDTAIIMHNAPRFDDGEIVLPDGTRWNSVEHDTYAHYPLVCAPGKIGGRWYLALDDRADLLPDGFNPEEVLGQLRDLIASICADPRGDYRGRGQIREITSEPSGVGEITGNIAALLWEKAVAQPEARAVWDSGRWWTYREIVLLARGIALHLNAHGVSAGERVLLQLPRHAEYFAALFGVLHLGAVAVPVDPEAPLARRDLILSRSAARAVIIDDGDLGSGDNGLANGRVPCLRIGDVSPAATIGEACTWVTAEDPAYVVFTSGSTGTPKGVVATHGGVLVYFANHVRRIYGPALVHGEHLRVAHGWSFAFDAAWQPQLALLAGHEMVLLDDTTRRNPELVVAALRELDVDMIDTSPSMLKALHTAGLLDSGGLRILALGSEDIPPDVWDELVERESVTVHNFYGPTETTVEVTSARLERGTRPNIGRPGIGTRTYVLGPDLASVPAGWPGELYIGGPQVTSGYLDDGSRTAGHFVAEPGYPGCRMYRTGDIVRQIDADGSLSYLGRADRQVKVRGYRIELGEVEAGLRRCPGVRDAAVTTVEDRLGSRVVGVVVADVPVDRVHESAAARLPAYLVPDRLIPVSEIPVDGNGKTRLTEIIETSKEQPRNRREPRTAAQCLVANAISDVTGIPDIGLDDDLRGLGIDSISVATLIAALRSHGAVITIRQAWEAETVEEIAEELTFGESEASNTSTAALAGQIDGPMLRWLRNRGDWRSYAMLLPLRIRADVDKEQVQHRLAVVARAHPGLAVRWEPLDDGGWRVRSIEPHVPVHNAGQVGLDELGRRVEAALAELDPESGIMLAGCLVRVRGELLLILGVHHLACDIYSLRVLLEDLRMAWLDPAAPVPMEEVTPFQWAADTTPSADELEMMQGYWDAVGADLPDSTPDQEPVCYGQLPEYADRQRLPLKAAMRCDEAIVLGAYACAWASVMGASEGGVPVILETHGRSGLADADVTRLDVGRTVGWLSTMFPHIIGDGQPPTIADLQDRTMAREWLNQVRRSRDLAESKVPGAWSSGILKERDGWAPAQSLVVFLGRTSSALRTTGPIAPVVDPEMILSLPTVTAPAMRCPHLVEVSIGVDLSGMDRVGAGSEGEVSAIWRWQEQVTDEEVRELREVFFTALRLLADIEETS
ncbi:amino acid adenylation domain-containing protein [Corynebacterium sp. TAE3-ERU12]|uniref:non-ribosomal peptide synthetase n=1 Tax=Corynebacterium sp. TAE3-ERU12 TaxID=2849491 RepID=UPI001C43950D|nr:non-ribosomal peptide synthetase [Corynebacterium sp. TAE3-ERU12]MBV7294669.1 amino acid adenylation domain-containing protein [Corynebacterium sp. TAE3-ERU12]